MISSSKPINKHTNEVATFHSYQVHHIQRDILQQYDLRRLFAHIEQQYELPALEEKMVLRCTAIKVITIACMAMKID